MNLKQINALLDSTLDTDHDPLDVPAGEVSPTLNSPNQRPVPNEFPTLSSPLRLAIVGEAPGGDEERAGRPFVGMSGKVLDGVLAKCGILRGSVFVGNVCQIRPPKNDITAFKLDGDEISSGLAQLGEDLTRFKPNLCLLLGRTALWAAKGTKNLGDWRGSVFIAEKLGPFVGLKCLAAYHPAACLRNYEWMPLLQFDVKRAAREATYPDLRLPERTLITNPTFEALTCFLQNILATRPSLSLDIEGGVNSISCISLALSPKESWIVPFVTLSGQSYWSVTQETEIWRLLLDILADRGIKKIWQNGLYDRFVFQYGNEVFVGGNEHDTLLEFWEAYCEMEKSLGFQCSILTDEPFYKFERKTEDQDTFYKYCCKDSALTFENHLKLDKILDPKQKEHYVFNHATLNILLYMELVGIRYNQTLATQRRDELELHIAKLQDELDLIAEQHVVVKRLDFSLSNQQILEQVNQICCYKRDSSTPKQDFVDRGYYDVKRLLLFDQPLDAPSRGLISVLCKTTMNVRSPAFKDFLYKTLKLPVQYANDPITKEPKVSANFESLLVLSVDHPCRVVDLALDITRLRTRLQMLSIRSVNGRMHCSYNLVGSETGRVTSSKSMIYVQS
jgi:uracil-DNA glycosylase